MKEKILIEKNLQIISLERKVSSMKHIIFTLLLVLFFVSISIVIAFHNEKLAYEGQLQYMRGLQTCLFTYQETYLKLLNCESDGAFNDYFSKDPKQLNNKTLLIPEYG